MPDILYDRLVTAAARRFNASGGSLDLCDLAQAASCGLHTIAFEEDVARKADELALEAE